MWNWTKKANELNEKGASFIIATIVENTGSTPREIGAKMIISSNGSFWGTIGGGAVEKSVIEESKKIFNDETSRTIEYALTQDEDLLCGGKLKVCFELLGSDPRLYIFGAGHVGQSLCNVMEESPFKVHLIDDRDEWIFSEKLPSSTIKHKDTYLNFIEKISFNAQKTYLAIMTPGHSMDQEVLEKLIKHDFKYLGLMGSRNKWNEIQTNLKEIGFSNEDISKVYCPIGTPIGGKSPREISISIASEIIKIYNGK